LGSEYERVLEFLERLVEAVGLPRYRVAFVPGNHDLNRGACSAYFEDQKADERAPRPPYWPKWRHYTAAFDRFYAGVTPPGGVGGPEFTPERPWSLFAMPDLNVVVAGLNSTMARASADDHYGWVGEDQLVWFAQQVRGYRDGDGGAPSTTTSCVRPWTTRRTCATRRPDRSGHRVSGYPNTGPGPLHLLLHGHTMTGGWTGCRFWAGPCRPVVPRPASARPVEVPNQYRVLTLQMTV
jgi:hypothetical protein